MMSPFIDLQHISRSFREGDSTQTVLRDVSLSMKRGETLALLGRSGSGKSTLLNIISGIDKPDEGVLIFDGLNLSLMSERERTLFRRKNIGFIYQFFNLIPTLTAEENVALSLELNEFKKSEIKNRTDAFLEKIGLIDKAKRFPDQLSGGEQQKISLARALIHEPRLILADEPTGNLDAESGHQVLGLLRSLLELQKGALILVTHSMAVAKSTDRIVTLENGVLEQRQGDFAW